MQGYALQKIYRGSGRAREGTNQKVRNYIIKRILQAILILFCVMFIIYALIRCLPSSFAQTMAIQLSQAPGAKPYEEWLQQLNASYGLDLDIVPGFFTWLSKAIVGNFGDSWKWNVPAVAKFNEVIGLSVIMGGISFVISLLIAVPLGVLAATKTVFPRGLYDHGGRTGGHFAADVLLCDVAEAVLLGQARVVRSVRPRRAKLCTARSVAPVPR